MYESIPQHLRIWVKASILIQSHSQHDLNGLISGNMEHELFQPPLTSGASLFSYAGCQKQHPPLGSVSTIHSPIFYGYKQLHIPIPFFYLQPFLDQPFDSDTSHHTASPQHLKFVGTPGGSDAAKEAMPLNSPIPWWHGWMA